VSIDRRTKRLTYIQDMGLHPFIHLEPPASWSWLVISTHKAYKFVCQASHQHSNTQKSSVEHWSYWHWTKLNSSFVYVDMVKYTTGTSLDVRNQAEPELVTAGWAPLASPVRGIGYGATSSQRLRTQSGRWVSCGRTSWRRSHSWRRGTDCPRGGSEDETGGDLNSDNCGLDFGGNIDSCGLAARSHDLKGTTLLRPCLQRGIEGQRRREAPGDALWGGWRNERRSGSECAKV
jgi:hypothetical protein